jgi:hypothetical protein
MNRFISYRTLPSPKIPQNPHWRMLFGGLLSLTELTATRKLRNVLRSDRAVCRSLAISYAESRGYIGWNSGSAVWNEEAISEDPLLGPGYLDRRSPEEIQLGYDYIRSLAQLGRSRKLCTT